MASKGAAIAAIVFAVLTLLAQFLSFVPYWLIEKDGETRIGPWFKLENNNTIGLESFSGNDAEWHLAAASATLLILLLAIFGLVAAVLHYRQVVDGTAVSPRKWCPPDLKTTLLIISVIQIAALITVAVCIAQAQSTLRVKDATGAVTTEYHFGVAYWFYLVLSFTGVFVGTLSSLCLGRDAGRRDARRRDAGHYMARFEKPADSTELQDLELIFAKKTQPINALSVI